MPCRLRELTRRKGSLEQRPFVTQCRSARIYCQAACQFQYRSLSRANMDNAPPNRRVTASVDSGPHRRPHASSPYLTKPHLTKPARSVIFGHCRRTGAWMDRRPSMDSSGRDARQGGRLGCVGHAITTNTCRFTLYDATSGLVQASRPRINEKW